MLDEFGKLKIVAVNILLSRRVVIDLGVINQRWEDMVHEVEVDDSVHEFLKSLDGLQAVSSGGVHPLQYLRLPREAGKLHLAIKII
jgi:ribulose 1,5-bisphosphate carboxylase large subunit-like protein